MHMESLLWIIGSTFIISLFSLVGILTIAWRKEKLEKILLTLVALASGALLGGAFLHLLPEAIEKFDKKNLFFWVLFAFIVFFIVEKILQWRHCHRGGCEVHPFGYMTILGDGIHNFIDGLIIAAAFTESIQFGLIVSLMVALHELPQEIGDFGVLLFAGFQRKKALIINFLTALTAMIGGLVGFFLVNYSNVFIKIAIPFAAGGFIYIGASDLLPEIRKTTKLKESIATLIAFLIGIGIIYLMKFIE